MPSLLRRFFSRKTFVRVAFVTVVLVTLLVTFVLEENWRGERAWRSYSAEARNAGVKLMLVDFLGPKVRDEQNFGAITMIREIFRTHAAGESSSNPFELPPPPQPEREAGAPQPEPPDLVKWRDHLVTIKFLDAAGPDPARDVLRALERFEPALQQLRDAAKRPHSRLPVRWEDGFGALLPHLSLFQGATKIIGLRTRAHLAMGESAAAYADFRDGLQLYRALEREPVIICGLVRISMLRMLENAIREGLAQNRWAEPELNALTNDLGGLRLLEDYHFAFASERGGMNQAINAMVESPDGLLKATQAAAGTDAKAPVWARIVAPLYPRGWVRQNQVLMNRLFDERLARVNSTEGVVAAGRTADEALRHIAGTGPIKRLYYFLANLFMPAFDHAEANYLAAHTHAQQAQTACALERFRRAQNTYPEGLAALVPAHLPAIPKDVMDGGPLRYRRTADGGYELWSLGVNRVDDQAATDPRKSQRDQPDWVWRLPAAARAEKS